MIRTLPPSKGVQCALLAAGPLLLWAMFMNVQGQLRADHFLLSALVGGLAWWGPRARRTLLAMSGFVGVAWLYDAMRFVKNVGLSTERVLLCSLAEFERAWFGFDAAGQRWTLHDWFLAHHTPVADAYFAFPYGTFLYAMIGYGFFLAARDAPGAMRYGWTFLLLNIAGFLTYHLVPAAPPWYFHAHGCTVNLGAQASEGAALARVDAMLGVPYFASFYGRSSDIFGAIPSLHVAYPLMLVWETWRRHARWTTVLAVLYWLSMSAAAVYLDHHWITDIVLGWLYAVVAMYLIYGLLPRLWPSGASQVSELASELASDQAR